MPPQYGMSLEQTAQAIGLSKGWVCRMRNKFITGEAVGDQGKSVHGGGGTERTLLLSARPNCSNRSWNLLVSAVFWWSARSNSNSKRRWDGRWRCRQCTSCCIGITGANSLLTKDTRKAILYAGRLEKNSPKSARTGPKTSLSD